jgi:imidazolonepropionase-like amidohydrolase
LIRALLLSAALGLTGQDLALVHAKVYPSPEVRPLTDATVLIRNGRIAAVGTQISVPATTQVIDCRGRPLMAGFWNCHAHFTEPKWSAAATAPAAELTANLQAMFTRYGFTSVVDLGSDPTATFPLRARLRAGEVQGPTLRSAGGPIYPAQGIPFYLDYLPAEVREHMFQPSTPEAARAIVAQTTWDRDLVKLFTGSWVARGKVKPMELAVAIAAVEAAHAKGLQVFAHPSNLEGTRVALEAGVDVLAHAPDDTRGIDGSLLQRMADRHMAMVPTLQLFHDIPGEDMAAIRDLVRDFHARGGELLFGTDVGYIPVYDPSVEFAQLGQLGLKTAEILRMLTTGPARHFGVESQVGRIAVGQTADLVVLAADPEQDSRAFAQVAWTLQAGTVRFTAAPAPRPR